MPRHSVRPPGRPKQNLDVRTEETILQVSAHLFMDHGYEATSVDAIARSANLTKAAVYYYYSTKADLFAAALRSLLTRILHESERILKSSDPLTDRLRRLSQLRLRAPSTRLNFADVMDEAKPHLNPEQQNELGELMDALPELLIAMLRQASETGEIAPIDPVFVAHAYSSLLEISFARQRDGTPWFPDQEKTVEDILRFVFRGISSDTRP